jgi:hypothetical protein
MKVPKRQTRSTQGQSPPPVASTAYEVQFMGVAADSLCMGCMELKQGRLCPNPNTCGWTEGTETRSFSQLPPRTVLDERYILGRVLGQGGFGITYLTGDLKEGRKLAVKEYFPTSFAARVTDRRTVTHAGPGNREPFQYGLKKFEEEGRTLQKFQTHPNIITVLKSFKANGTGYIVMEYLDGVTLLNHLQRKQENKIPFDEALRILVPIMDALREVHLVGMIHRDISPDNIYLCRSGRIKLLDFGAARLALRDQTQSQQLILKLGYTPEEQYRSAGVAGPYTDIYSLAATMYRCITGLLPPEAPERLSADLLEPPSKLAKLPRRAEMALIKALAVRSRDRYQTVEAFQQDISPPPRPPTPPRPPRSESVEEVIRGFTVWWTIGAVIMLAGSLITGQAFWLFWVGLIPASVALIKIAGLGRFNVGPRPGLGFLFGCLVVLGILLTGLSPLGVVVLVGNIFVGRAMGAKRAEQRIDSPQPRFGVRCISGELAGNALGLSRSPVVFGRVPDRANVVIPLHQISAAHARVWTDPANSGVWIEDLKSRNGTYVQKKIISSGWVALNGRELLAKGDRFYLAAQELATFEIECSE